MGPEKASVAEGLEGAVRNSDSSLTFWVNDWAGCAMRVKDLQILSQEQLKKSRCADALYLQVQKAVCESLDQSLRRIHRSELAA